MKKYLFLFFFAIGINGIVFAQIQNNIPDSTTLLKKYNKNKSKTDSSLIAVDTPSSFFQAGFGVGNNLTSKLNNAIRAQQVANTIAYTPTVAYYNKSGFNIVANEYLLNEGKGNKFGVNQYSVTPAFETNEKAAVDFLASFTHFFVLNHYSIYSSPVQNDFITYAVYRKTILQPGLGLEYSGGFFKDVSTLDTTIKNVKEHYYDSTTNHITSFAIEPMLQHKFKSKSLLTKDDEFSFIPSLSFNFTNLNTTVDSKTNVSGNASLTKRLNKLLSKRTQKLQSFSFQLESISLDLSMEYSIGSFSLEPEVYLDYYTATTTTNRFTQIYTVNLLYSF